MQQQTPPWRVFDRPAAEGPAGSAAEPASTSARTNAVRPNIVLATAGIAGAVLIGVVAILVALSPAGGQTIEGPEASTVAAASSRAVAVGAEIVIDVAGAVVKPGLYHLGSAARVGDAIDAAGGFNPRVDAERVTRELNLAAPLKDGEQVRVPSRDDPPPAPGGGTKPGGGSPAGLLDLNAATQAELEELPGIGPVTAGKIIAARTETPFRAVDDLRERGLVGEKTFADIRPLVTVG